MELMYRSGHSPSMSSLRAVPQLTIGLSALVVAIVVLAALGAPAAASSADDIENGTPNVVLHLPENDLDAGTDDVLVLQVENAAHPEDRGDPPELLVARSVTLEVTDPGPFDVRTERQSVGTLEAGMIQPAEIGLTVPEGVAPGSYEIDLEVTYANVTDEREEITRHQTIDRTVTVEVVERPRFAIETVETTAQIGSEGTLVVELENVGETTARDLTLALEAETARVGFAAGPERSPTEAGSIDELAPGESTTLAFDVEVAPDVAEQVYGLDGTVRYTDEDGLRGVDDRPTATFEPLEAQEFRIFGVDSTLRPGEPGTVAGTIVNEGPLPIEDAVVRFEAGPFEPRSPTHAIGDLDPGENARVEFRGTIPRGADAVPQRVDLLTEYTTVEGVDRLSRESIQVPVEDRRDAIAVEAVNATFAAGDEGDLVLELTNQRDVDLRDVRVTMVAEAPIETEFHTTGLERLAPGESDRVVFDVDVDSDARETTYPTVVEIQYVDEDDEPREVRPQTVSVSVIDDPVGVFFAVEILVFVVVAILVAAAFYWLYRR